MSLIRTRQKLTGLVVTLNEYVIDGCWWLRLGNSIDGGLDVNFVNEADIEMVDFYQAIFFVMLRKIVVECVVGPVEF